ncbi:MAG: serine--tRNA ligase, partial [Exiguobacterium chiriqhucha]
MLDIKRLRSDFEEIKTKLAHRGEDLSALDRFPELEEKRRNLINEVEVKKAKRNEATKQIAELKRNKQDADAPILETRRLGDEIKLL